MEKYTVDPDKVTFMKTPERSEWKCYLFGSKGYDGGIIYHPLKNAVPNWFVRWMMRICLGCTWVKEKNNVQ